MRRAQPEWQPRRFSKFAWPCWRSRSCLFDGIGGGSYMKIRKSNVSSPSMRPPWSSRQRADTRENSRDFVHVIRVRCGARSCVSESNFSCTSRWRADERIENGHGRKFARFRTRNSSPLRRKELRRHLDGLRAPSDDGPKSPVNRLVEDSRDFVHENRDCCGARRYAPKRHRRESAEPQGERQVYPFAPRSGKNQAEIHRAGEINGGPARFS